jgi:hypothetical protein
MLRWWLPWIPKACCSSGSWIAGLPPQSKCGFRFAPLCAVGLSEPTPVIQDPSSSGDTSKCLVMAVTTPLLLHWRILHSSFVVMCTGGYQPRAICCCCRRLLRAIHCSCTGEHQRCACSSISCCWRSLGAFVVVVVGAGDPSTHSCYLSIVEAGDTSVHSWFHLGDSSIVGVVLFVAVPVEADRVPFCCRCRRLLRSFVDVLVCGDSTACLFRRSLRSIVCCLFGRGLDSARDSSVHS